MSDFHATRASALWPLEGRRTEEVQSVNDVKGDMLAETPHGVYRCVVSAIACNGPYVSDSGSVQVQDKYCS